MTSVLVGYIIYVTNKEKMMLYLLAFSLCVVLPVYIIVEVYASYARQNKVDK